MNKINKKELHEIFQSLRNKNQNAYNNLYEKYYKLVYGIVFSIIKNQADSEDVTHEIFTKIYKLDINKLPENHEASWLFTVSKNECLLFLRKSKPNISIEEIYEIPENTNGIDDVIDKDYYNKLISGLKEDEKIIVSLKVLSNFTFKKISQVMNIPIGTVQWKYYNAINSLKVSIGSLVGAALAFIIVIARGEFWKEKEYLKDNKEKDISDNKTETDNNKNQEETEIQGQDGSSVIQNIENQASENKNEKEDSNSISETTTSSEVENTTAVQGNSLNNFDGIQIASLTIGITLLVIFIIFFKKYQQKLKKKSSK